MDFSKRLPFIRIGGNANDFRKGGFNSQGYPDGWSARLQIVPIMRSFRRIKRERCGASVVKLIALCTRDERALLERQRGHEHNRRRP